MLKRYVLRSDKIKLLVIDEADEMLSAGFKEQIYDILQYIPQEMTRDYLVQYIRRNIRNYKPNYEKPIKNCSKKG